MAAPTTRAQRIDAGRVVLTERDRDVLAFVVDHGGVRLDCLALALARLGPDGRLAPARSPRVARARVDRMARAGLVRRAAVLAAPWVLATVAGSRVAIGRERPGRVTRHMADHHYTVAMLPVVAGRPACRGELVAGVAATGRLAGAGPPAPMGSSQWPDGYRAGVEVELTPKRSDRYARIVAEQHPSLHAVWWFALEPQTGRLERLLGRPGAPARPVHKVFPLPVGVA